MADGHGGKRKGAGRPRGVNSRRSAVMSEILGDDAQEAIALLRLFMRDPKQTARLRKDCAIELLDRAIGRPTQHQISDTEIIWHIVHDRDDSEQARADNHDTPATPVPETARDQGQPGEAESDGLGPTLGQDDARQ